MKRKKWMRTIEYHQYLKTFRDISVDTANNEYMTSLGILAIDFDKFLEAFFKNNDVKSKKPESKVNYG